MNLLSILLSLLAILVVLVLLIWRKMAADLAGLIGWLLAALSAWLYFKTPLTVTLQASLAGIIAFFPITLMVATSLLQVFIMAETGAIAMLTALYLLTAEKYKCDRPAGSSLQRDRGRAGQAACTIRSSSARPSRPANSNPKARDWPSFTAFTQLLLGNACSA
jgi:hypothetical protein